MGAVNCIGGLSVRTWRGIPFRWPRRRWDGNMY